MAKSNGHILFSGPFEYFERGGEVYRAKTGPAGDAFDIYGYRMGRWECSREHFDRYRSVVVGE